MKSNLMKRQPSNPAPQNKHASIQMILYIIAENLITELCGNIRKSNSMTATRPTYDVTP